MDADSGPIGRINLDVARWMRPQPVPQLTENSRPIATAGINWAKLQGVNAAVIVTLQFRRDQGVAWYGDEVHSHNGHDSLAHSAQEAVDGYYYATQWRIERDTQAARLLCELYLTLLSHLLEQLDARDRGIADERTEEWVPPVSLPLAQTPQTERQSMPAPVHTRRCCLNAASGLTFVCQDPTDCATYRPAG